MCISTVEIMFFQRFPSIFGPEGVNFGWHFLFFEYVFRNLNPKPSDPIRRYNATFLQLQALYSATHDCCACSVVGVFVVSMSCGPELRRHGGADRYFRDMMLIETDFFMTLDCFSAEKKKSARVLRLYVKKILRSTPRGFAMLQVRMFVPTDVTSYDSIDFLTCPTLSSASKLGNPQFFQRHAASGVVHFGEKVKNQRKSCISGGTL